MRWGAAALVAGTLLRIFFVHKHAIFGGDALTYGDLAHNMLAHHIFGFTERTVRPTLIRLPGYPLFLAACFLIFGDANYLAVLWVQVLVDLASCVLLGLLVYRLMGQRAGMIALWLAALCPFTANYAAAALTETLSIFCIVLGFFALQRWQDGWNEGRRSLGLATLVGAALAFAVLLRPDQGLLAAVIVPTMAWLGWKSSRGSTATRLAPAAVASLVVVLPLLVWAGRNWRTFHVIQPLAPRYANDPGEGVPFGFQRWYRTWAIDFKATVDVYWDYDGGPLWMRDLPPRAFDDARQMDQTRRLFARYNEETSSTPAFDAEFGRIAADRVALHPLRYYIVMPVARDLNMWLRPRTELMKVPIDWWMFREHPRQSAAAMVYALLNAAYLLLAILGWVRWRRVAWNGHAALAYALTAFLILRTLLLLQLDNSEPRYTLEGFPVIIVLAAIGLSRTQQKPSVPQAISD